MLPDADKEGVTNQFDKELNTIKGCPVDSHGVSLDTDKDGVIDCKDKEPLTQRDCIPVDSLGRGLCLEPACCHTNIISDPITCHLHYLPNLQFEKNEFDLSKIIETALDSEATQMNNEPYCHLKIYAQNKSSNKQTNQIAYKRGTTIVKYLTDRKLIDSTRIKLIIGNGDSDIVFLSASID